MHYLTSIHQAKEEIKKRRGMKDLVRMTLDQHMGAKFGISNFSQLVSSQIFSSFIGNKTPVNDEAVFGVLARQVPGVCVEDLACYLLSLKLGLTPCSLAFTRDTFHSNSNDKLFRAKIPFTSWSKKGNLVVTHESVLSKNGSSYTDLDMIRLDRLAVKDVMLPEYHRTMQRSVCDHFPQQYVWGDVSKLWGEILAQARISLKHPDAVWRCGNDNKDRLCSKGFTIDEARSLIVRPSSKWYYHLYLSMFLDGTFVLLETYDNETGGVPEARRLFEKEMDAIYKATGFMPLVVKTYPLRQDMLYVNQHIIEEPHKAGEILSSRKYWSDDTCSMTRWLADQVLQVGCPI